MYGARQQTDITLMRVTCFTVVDSIHGKVNPRLIYAERAVSMTHRPFHMRLTAKAELFDV